METNVKNQILSKFLEFKQDKNNKQKKHITSNGKYFISTNLTWDKGWETMVFSRNPDTDDIDWTELYADHYNDQDEAYAGHEVVVETWEAKD